jgi:hypothetical protein
MNLGKAVYKWLDDAENDGSLNEWYVRVDSTWNTTLIAEYIIDELDIDEEDEEEVYDLVLDWFDGRGIDVI